MPLSTLLAFGGNSSAARSIRARLQWRGKDGKFIDMGRGIKFSVRRPDGSVFDANGTYVGPASDQVDSEGHATLGQIYVHGDPNGLKDGFYTVPSSNAVPTEGQLTPAELEAAHINPDAAANAADRADAQNEAEIPYSEVPFGWQKNENGTFSTTDGTYTVRMAQVGNTPDLALYRDNQFKGYYNPTDWSRLLQDVNRFDADNEAAKPQREAAMQDAVAKYDNANHDAAKLVNSGASATEVIAKLNEISPEFRGLYEDRQHPADFRNAQQRAADAQFEKDFRAISHIDSKDRDKDNNKLPEGDDPGSAVSNAATPLPSPSNPTHPANIIDHVLKNGGHTLDLNTGDVAKEGFIVATQGNNLEVPEEDFFGDKGLDTLVNYIHDHKAALTEGGQRLGLWHDTQNHEVVLDVVDQVADQDEAVKLGAARNQQAIWDVANNKEIPTGGTGDRAADHANEPVNPGSEEHVASREANEPGTATDTDTGRQPANPDSSSQQPSVNDASGNQGMDNAPVQPVQREEQPEPSSTPAPDANASVPTAAPENGPDDAGVTSPDVDSEGLPNNVPALQRMATRLEGRAAAEADKPSVDTINDTLDKVYAKIDRLNNNNGQAEAPEKTENTPAPEASVPEETAKPAPQIGSKDGETDPGVSGRATKQPNSGYAELDKDGVIVGLHPTQKAAREAEAKNPDGYRKPPLQVDVQRGGRLASPPKAKVPAAAPAPEPSAHNAPSAPSVDPDKFPATAHADDIKAAEADVANRQKSLDGFLNSYAGHKTGSQAKKIPPLNSPHRAEHDRRAAALKSAQDHLDNLRKVQPAPHTERDENSPAPEAGRILTPSQALFVPKGTTVRARATGHRYTKEGAGWHSHQTNTTATDGEKNEILQSAIRGDLVAEKNPDNPENKFPSTSNEAVGEPKQDQGGEGDEGGGNAAPDGLPDDSQALEQMATNLEARLAQNMGKLAQKHIEAMLDKVYAKLNNESPAQNAPENAPNEAVNAPDAAPNEAPPLPKYDGNQPLAPLAPPRPFADENERQQALNPQEPEPETPEPEAPQEPEAPNEPNEAPNEPAAPAEPAPEAEPEAPAPAAEPEPDNTPASDAAKNVIRNQAAGKLLSDDQKKRVDALLQGNPTRDDVNQAHEDLKNAPNQPVTKSQPLSEAENVSHFTNADPDLTAKEANPNEILDPNLIMDDVLANHPAHEILPNGDVVIERAQANGKTYELAVRRTPKERFFAYVREIDPETGEIRASKLGNESHSYRALLTKINRGKSGLRRPRPDRWFNQRRNIETNGNPEVQDRFTGMIDGTDMPKTHDEIHDAAVAEIAKLIHFRGPTDAIAQRATELGVSDSLLHEISQSVVRRKVQAEKLKMIGGEQNKADGVNLVSHIPYNGGAALKKGDYVDWTDWRKTSPTYGRVFRGWIVQPKYRDQGANGKFVYSDHVDAVFPEYNKLMGAKFPNSRSRDFTSANLMRVDKADPISKPFFAKQRELEQQDKVFDHKQFGVPANPEHKSDPVPQKHAPSRPHEADVKIDVNGKSYVGDDRNPLGVPEDEAKLADEVRTARGTRARTQELRPGDILMRNGQPEKILTAEHANEGGGYQSKLTTARFDNGKLVTQDRRLAGNGEHLVMRQPENANTPLPATRKVGDKVNVADIPGGKGTITAVLGPDAKGEPLYKVLPDGFKSSAGLDVLREERYIDSPLPKEDAPQAASLQPAAVINDAKWKKDMASPAQRNWIQKMRDSKQLSDASKQVVDNALARDDLTKGEASALIDELKNHKNARQINDPAKKADEALNALGGFNEDAKKDANAAEAGDPQHIDDGIAAARQAAANIEPKVEEDPYGGYSVKKLAFKDVRAVGRGAPFTNMPNIPAKDIEPGDIRVSGRGVHKSYQQVLENRGGGILRVRIIGNPDEPWGWAAQNDGKIRTIGVDDIAHNIKRPNKNMPKDYFKDPQHVVAAPPAIPKKEPLPPENEADDSGDYATRSARQLAEWNEGHTFIKNHGGRDRVGGAMNQGSAFVRLNSGRTVFWKRVRSQEEQQREVVAQQLAHKLGVQSVVVTALPQDSDGYWPLIQTKAPGKLADDRRALLDTAIESDAGRRIGMLDMLIGNADRHEGNWLIDDNNQPIPIDHGNAWYRMGDVSSPFARRFFGPLRFGGDGAWMRQLPQVVDPRQYTASELSDIRTELQTLEQVYGGAGQTDNFERMIENIDTLIDRATRFEAAMKERGN